MPLSPMDPRHFQAAPRPVGSAPAHVQVAPLAQTDRHYRIPTIEEAFPYTPLSSILPFDAGMLYLPHCRFMPAIPFSGWEPNAGLLLISRC